MSQYSFIRFPPMWASHNWFLAASFTSITLVKKPQMLNSCSFEWSN